MGIKEIIASVGKNLHPIIITEQARVGWAGLVKPNRNPWNNNSCFVGLRTTAQPTRLLFICLFAALTSACTTTERMSWVGVGGSKADGTIILGIDVPPKMGVRETIVQWDTQQANAEANKRCQNWGYGSAEVFNNHFPVQVICHPQGISPCWSKTYRIMYQCAGNLREEPLTP